MSVSTLIACPSCQKKFQGRPELRGKKVRCPGCDHAFVVEAVTAEADDADLPKKGSPKKAGATGPAGNAKATGKSKPAAGARPASKPSAAGPDDDEDANPYGVTHLDLVPRCPHCANELESEEAIICLHCGYNTETREIGKTTTVYGTSGGEHFMWLLPGIGSGLAVVFLSIFCLFFSLALPGMLGPKSWMRFLDHESMRMWLTLICLAIMWPIGFFAYKRLIMEPRPMEKKKD